MADPRWERRTRSRGEGWLGNGADRRERRAPVGTRLEVFGLPPSADAAGPMLPRRCTWLAPALVGLEIWAAGGTG